MGGTSPSSSALLCTLTRVASAEAATGEEEEAGGVDKMRTFACVLDCACGDCCDALLLKGDAAEVEKRANGDEPSG